VIRDARTVDLPPFADLRSVAEVESLGLDRFAPERTVYEMLARSSERDPQRRATWHFASGEPGARETHLTYEELMDRVSAAANLFHGLGVARGDVVACLLPSLAEVHEIVWGAATAGIACGINHFLEPQLIAAMLERTGARVLVVPGPDGNAEIWAKVEQLRQSVPGLSAIVRVGGGRKGSTIVARLRGSEGCHSGASHRRPTTSPRTSTPAAPPVPRSSRRRRIVGR
jgi:fatty-acyl-CoA synthase